MITFMPMRGSGQACSPEAVIRGGMLNTTKYIQLHAVGLYLPFAEEIENQCCHACLQGSC